MTDKRTRFHSAIVLIVILAAAPACFGQKPAEGVAKSSRYDLLVQYAKTNMELAEVELQQALKINAESSGAIPRLTIERLRSSLAVAREQFNQAEMASFGGQERVRLRHAEERIRVAKLALETAQKQKSDGVISSLELTRLQLRYDLAKLSLTLIKNPENFATLLHHLEGQVNRLGDEILAIDQRLSKFESLRY